MDDLKFISAKIAEQKTLVVHQTWHDWFKLVTNEMNDNLSLETALYEQAGDFYEEQTRYRHMALENLPSNNIKKILHEILSNAIFAYCPSKDLIEAVKEKYRPDCIRWAGHKNKWLALTCDPYQIVSQIDV